nr:hypothetical protein [Tanacetum cinerariifolium]
SAHRAPSHAAQPGCGGCPAPGACRGPGAGPRGRTSPARRGAVLV